MSMPPETPPSPAALPSVEYGSRTMVDPDNEHLKILSICWYVMGGISGLFGFFPFIHLFMGIAMFVGAFPTAPGGPPFPNHIIGGFMIAIAGAFILMLWTCAVLSLLTARSLSWRRRRTLCFVTAGIACMQIPIGTVLGVFTILVLSRPSVKSQFAQSTT